MRPTRQAVRSVHKIRVTEPSKGREEESRTCFRSVHCSHPSAGRRAPPQESASTAPSRVQPRRTRRFKIRSTGPHPRSAAPSRLHLRPDRRAAWRRARQSPPSPRLVPSPTRGLARSRRRGSRPKIRLGLEESRQRSVPVISGKKMRKRTAFAYLESEVHVFDLVVHLVDPSLQ